MRSSLASLLFAAVAQALDNETIILDAFEIKDLTDSEEPLMGTLTVKTGWKSQGGDGLVDYELQLLMVGTEAYPFFYSTWPTWTLAMSENATVEKAEYYRLYAEET